MNKTNFITYLVLRDPKNRYEFLLPYNDILSSPALNTVIRLKKNDWFYENNNVYHNGRTTNIVVLSAVTPKAVARYPTRVLSSAGTKVNQPYGNKKNIFLIKDGMIKILKNKPKNIYKDDDPLMIKLKHEFARYMVIQDIIKINKNNKSLYETEWLKILERFFSTMANITDIKKHDALLIDIEVSHPIYKTLIAEITEKQNQNLELIVSFLKNL